MAIWDEDGGGNLRFYATNVLTVDGEQYVGGAWKYWRFFERDGSDQHGVGMPDGNYFRIDITEINFGSSKGYQDDYAILIFTDFGTRISGDRLQYSAYQREFMPYHFDFEVVIYGTNDGGAWGDIDHASWVRIVDSDWSGPFSPPIDWGWVGWGLDPLSYLKPGYRFFAWTIATGQAEPIGRDANYYDFDSFRISDADGNIHPPYRFSVSDAKSLVCDHQYGDTLYLGLRGSNQRPLVMWVDWDFGDARLGYKATGGSSVGVQTVELRNTCIAYGQFGTDMQIIISEDRLSTWDQAQGMFGDDDVLTLKFHPSSEDDLVATRKVDQDYIQTLTQRAPWTDLGATPFVARSQLRVGNDIWIGSETGGSSVVQLLSDGSWADKSTGLPNVPINDLESA